MVRQLQQDGEMLDGVSTIIKKLKKILFISLKIIIFNFNLNFFQDERGSSDLLKVTINLVPQSKCNKLFIGNEKNNKLKFGIIGDWQICAGELGKDTCQVIIF